MSAEATCQNCGRLFTRKDPNQIHYELDCSDICRINSRKRLKELGRRAQPTLRRTRHVEPVQVMGRRWLMTLWPAYRRRVERDARLVWIAVEEIGRAGVRGFDRINVHWPPELCQVCGVACRTSTRATRTKKGLVYCSPEHLAVARPLPEPLRPACPRPDKQGRYGTQEEAERADPIRLRGIERFHAYLCACGWWHLGKERDWGDTIGARAKISRWDAS